MVPPKSSRLSYHPDTSSLFPTSPTVSRGTRASSVFPYSLARPPTNYSQNSWLPGKQGSHPPLPRPQSRYRTRTRRGTLDSQPSGESGREKITEHEGEEMMDDYGETPLYARSDWDETPRAAQTLYADGALVDSPATIRRLTPPSPTQGTALTGYDRRSLAPTAPTESIWSRSSYAGGMTGHPTSRYATNTGLGGIIEEDEDEGLSPDYSAAGRNGSSSAAGAYEGAGRDFVESPGPRTGLPPTPWSALEKKTPRQHSPLPLKRYSSFTGHRGDSSRANRQTPMPGGSASLSRRPQDQTNSLSCQTGGQTLTDKDSDPFADWYSPERQSTLPSILDLEHLTGTHPQAQDPFADSSRYRSMQHHKTTSHSIFPPVPDMPPGQKYPGLFPPPLPTPAVDAQGGDGPGGVMTPGAHQKLGRMSVATARYTTKGKKKKGKKHKNHKQLKESDLAKDQGHMFHPANEKPGSQTLQARADRRSGSTGRSKRPLGGTASWRDNKLVQWYMTWRPFISSFSALTCALLLTITVQNSDTLVSPLLKVDVGVFNISAADPQPVGLGVSGWCQLGGQDPACRGYRRGDFSTSNKAFVLPGDLLVDDVAFPLFSSLLSSVGNLYTALTTMTWLLALYLLTSAFCHFYLFFALSIPFTHLIEETSPRSTAPDGALTYGDEKSRHRRREGGNVGWEHGDEGQGKGLVQAEVDIRVKCERPPYEGYIWVWWAWWAHRKSPVGVIFGLAVGTMAISGFAVAMGFYKQVIRATSAEGVRMGGATIVPFAVFLFTVDPLISSVQWLSQASRSWSTFLHPPEPSPAAIMLPSRPPRLQHLRPTTGRSSFFAQRTTLAPTTAYGQDPPRGHTDEVPPLPLNMAKPDAAEPDLDEETSRWLEAYPLDRELVPLITSLRSGQENDDFLLSEVGLLYLRPEGEEPALLVPPAGEIRRELMEDAHVPLPSEEDLDKVTRGEMDGEDLELDHKTVDEMMEELNDTFWWMTMEEDVVEFAKTCEGCARKKIDLKPGMTALEYTGITGWTGTVGGQTGYGAGHVGESAMAAEMAFAMRKADEDAERNAF